MSRDGIGWPRTATNGLQSATDSALHRTHACARLHEPAAPALRLFYGGPRAELERVLVDGFDKVPVDPHDVTIYGRGWYFSK